MFKMITFGVLILGLIVWGAWYFISPVFIVIEANDTLPTDIIEENEQTNTPEVSEVLSVEYQGLLVPDAHEVEGEVKIISTDEGRILRFENLDTVNGPDLRIYLSKDESANDIIDLGEIKATKGNVNYVIPDGVDVSQYSNVLIWCRQFSVLFSHAKLS